MTILREPDQIATRWDDHVSVYEDVFEPFTLALTAPALNSLDLAPGARVLDVGAGPGGAALALAARGYRVLAVDASEAMVERIGARAAAAGLPVEAQTMDATLLALPDDTFDAAISAFGIVLLPDAAKGLAEMARVVRPGGRVAVVTWTAPERYELAVILNAAIASVWPDRPCSPLPAQLRFREADDFKRLFLNSGLPEPAIETVQAEFAAPSARWLSERLDVTPGMAALLDGLGTRRDAALKAFVSTLGARFGEGPVRLTGVAFCGSAIVGAEADIAKSV